MKVALYFFILIVASVARFPDNQLRANTCALLKLFKNSTKLRIPGFYGFYTQINGDGDGDGDGDGECSLFLCLDKKLSVFDPTEQKCVNNLSIVSEYKYTCNTTPDFAKMPDPANCTNFHYCLHKQKYTVACENGYYYHHEEQKCLHPENTKCMYGINNICEIAGNGTLFRDEKYCFKYYQCVNGKQIEYTCRNQYFDVEAGMCMNTSDKCIYRSF